MNDDIIMLLVIPHLDPIPLTHPIMSKVSHRFEGDHLGSESSH